MSDFDEEAERERLREKYEKEEQQREATERMSELLLKGATMTNSHCGTCGDPIFRYEGQHFCPTCEEVVAEDGQTPEESEQAEAEQQEGTATGEASGDQREQRPAENGTTPEERADVSERERGTNGDSTEADERADEPRSDLPERRERAQVPDRDRRPTGAPRRPDPPVRREESDERASPERPAESASGDLAEARESLRRSLVRFAREAERTEDPRRATEHLEAAHEAAEGLAAISEIR